MGIYLRKTWASSGGADPVTSFVALLESEAIAEFTAIDGGKFVTGVSRNNAAGGQSTQQITLPGLSPVQSSELKARALELYYETEETLTNPTEEDVYNEMLGGNKPCTEYTADFSQLRTGRSAPV
jgi:hypothetical protein